MSTLSDPYSALRVRDYRFYLSSSLIGTLGYQILMLALGYDLYNKTNNYMSLGWLGLVTTIPVFVFTLPAGQLADSFNRKHMIILALFIACVGSTGLVLASKYDMPLWMIYACVVVRSGAGTFTQPARQALLPQVVPSEFFGNAVTWNSSIIQTALLAGPALGGFIAGKSVEAAYLADAGCMIISAACIATVHASGHVKQREPATMKTVAAGLRYVFHTKVILAALSLDLMATIFGGATALLPGYAKDILHVDAAGLGWLTAAPAAGAVTMAAVLAHMRPIRKAGRAMILAVIGFGMATILFGVSTNFSLSLFFLLLVGAFDNISVVVRHTLVQCLAPEEMRGRISAVNSMFIGASNKLSQFESGITARFMGPVGSVVLGGAASIVCVILAAFKWPELRRIGSLSDLKPETVPAVLGGPDSEAIGVAQAISTPEKTL